MIQNNFFFLKLSETDRTSINKESLQKWLKVLLNKEQVESIQNRKVTHVNNFDFIRKRV